MKQIRVPLEGFDMDSFLDAFLDFEEDQFAEPFSSVYIVGSLGDQPVNLDPGHNDIYREMGVDRKLVFFSFTAAALENCVECMDGGVYEAVPATGNELEDYRNRFYPSEVTYVGYLMSLQNGYMVIDTALFYSGSPMNDPTLELIDHCGILDIPMEVYIRQYIL
ncbi:MAG: hypothetical protein JW971_09540 [Synergistales bacterium]|nr:hypothetical protein [Synergistales bacterium]